MSTARTLRPRVDFGDDHDAGALSCLPCRRSGLASSPASVTKAAEEATSIAIEGAKQMAPNPLKIRSASKGESSSSLAPVASPTILRPAGRAAARASGHLAKACDVEERPLEVLDGRVL